MDIVAIMGPTASGKSHLALTLAQKYKGEIVNFDSMQVYTGLDILTACPSKQEKSLALHHLYQFQDVATPLNAAAWATLAAEKITEIHQKGHLPILVGGTGFYLKTLMQGISPIPDIDENIVQKLTLRAEDEGMVSLYTELQKKDAPLAQILKPNDKQRIIRALSVFEATKKPLSLWQKEPMQPYIKEAKWKIIGLLPEREALYERCDKRFDHMIKNGGLEEAKQLHEGELSYDLPALRAVGIRQLLAYYDKEWDLETAIIKGKTATRNYAKRQMTWLRNQLKDSLVFSDFGHNINGDIHL